MSERFDSIAHADEFYKARISRLSKENHRLRADKAKLRGALRPLATMGEIMDGDKSCSCVVRLYHDSGGHVAIITRDDARHAAEVMEETDAQHKE